MIKVCSKCKIEKEILLFSKSSKSKDGLKSACKECHSKQNKEWYSKNIEQESNRKKEQYKRDRNKISIRMKFYNQKKYQVCLEKTREWRKQNPEKFKKQAREYFKKVRTGEKGELAFLRNRIRKIISNSIISNGYKKESKTCALLGCTFESLLLEIGPKPTQSCQLDHICPCAQAQNEEELIKLQHYTNFRWLPAEENLSKSDSWTSEGAELCRILLNREWVFTDEKSSGV